jgi:hypothetical protein
MARRTTTNTEVTGWVGWVYFAGLMLMLAGVFQSIAGLVALFKDEVFVVSQQNLWLLDYTTWGWVHLLIGVFLLMAGSAIASGKVWGRTIGVVFAALGLIANFGFIPVYPLWSILLVVVDGLGIYALIVHGGEAVDLE